MVVHKKGHKNSKGEKAEWCIVSHDTGKILRSHKSKAAAESHLTDMRKCKHMKEDFDSAKKFLENKGYILLKENADIKSEIRELIKDLFENKIIDSYGDFTDEGRNIIQDKCGRRFRNFVPVPDGSLKQLLDDTIGENSIHIVDFHAEATGEKMCIGYCFDGLVSAVLGTHTHVQTNDNKILSNGTAFISDVGMCGARNGVLGFEKNSVIQKTIFGNNERFTLDEKDDYIVNAVVLDIDEISLKCHEIIKINMLLENK